MSLSCTPWIVRKRGSMGNIFYIFMELDLSKFNIMQAVVLNMLNISGGGVRRRSVEEEEGGGVDLAPSSRLHIHMITGDSSIVTSDVKQYRHCWYAPTRQCEGY